MRKDGCASDESLTVYILDALLPLRSLPTFAQAGWLQVVGSGLAASPFT
jgi:hypothetical protein